MRQEVSCGQVLTWTMGALPFVLEPVERIWKLFLLSGMVLGVGQAVAGCINEVLFVNLSWIFFLATSAFAINVVWWVVSWAAVSWKAEGSSVGFSQFRFFTLCVCVYNCWCFFVCLFLPEVISLYRCLKRCANLCGKQCGKVTYRTSTVFWEVTERLTS